MYHWKSSEIIHTTRESSRCQNLDICMLWISELLTQRLQRPSHQRQWSSHSRASTMKKDLAVKKPALRRVIPLYHLALPCYLLLSFSLPFTKQHLWVSSQKVLRCNHSEDIAMSLSDGRSTAYFEVALNAKKVMVCLTPRWIAWKA